MIETQGSIWSHFPCQAAVIPTNGETNAKGEAIMGKGVALQAAKLYTDLPLRLGAVLKATGNICYVFFMPDGALITFPTKGDWKRPSTLSRIEKSLHQLVFLANSLQIQNISLPLVGCGAGGLSKESVKPLLEKHLDDRFTLLTPTEP